MTETEGKVKATGAGKVMNGGVDTENHMYISSEAVSMGHPDKLADQISAKIVTNILAIDPEARTAIEVAGSGNQVYVFGETTILAEPEGKGSTPDQRKTLDNKSFEALVGKSFVQVLKEVGGYGKEDILGYQLKVNVQPQSVDIADKVANDDGTIKGAGDQGMMYGYASDETDNFMPYAYNLARKFIKKLEDERLSGDMKDLGPDAKVMVTVDKAQENRLVDLVISTQTVAPIMESNGKAFKNEMLQKVVIPVLYEDKVNMRVSQNTGDVLTTKYGDPILKDYMREVLLEHFHLNEGGDFVLGGFTADAGLTGRKIIYDTYGGMAHHGGGNVWGKDGSKVDVSGLLMARYMAKNILATLKASGKRDVHDINVQLSYGIGQPEPTAVTVWGDGLSDELARKYEQVMIDNVDLSPEGIIEQFDLRHFDYSSIAHGGAFGRDDLDLPWERLLG